MLIRWMLIRRNPIRLMRILWKIIRRMPIHQMPIHWMPIWRMHICWMPVSRMQIRRKLIRRMPSAKFGFTECTFGDFATFWYSHMLGVGYPAVSPNSHSPNPDSSNWFIGCQFDKCVSPNDDSSNADSPRSNRRMFIQPMPIRSIYS